jgi:hypothetical protein
MPTIGGRYRSIRLEIARAAIRRAAKDPRFFKYMCELHPGLVMGPFFVIAAILALSRASGFKSLAGVNAVLRLIVVVMGLVSLWLEFGVQRRRYRRFVEARITVGGRRTR